MSDWTPGNLTATIGVSTSTIAQGMNIYYDKKFLRRYAYSLQIAPLGQKRPLPKGNGKQIDFFRYHDLSVSLSGAHLTEGHNPDPTLVTGQKVSATIQEWGAFSQHSSLVKDTHIDRNLAGVTELWGEHGAKIMDLLCSCEVAANGAYPIRADLAKATGAYYVSGTVTSATTTAVTAASMFANTAFGGETDDLNQSVIIMTSGTCKGQARAIYDYAVSDPNGTAQVTPAFEAAPAAGDSYIVVSAHGLTTSDVLTTANIRYAVQTLRNNGAVPFDGNFFVGVLCPDTEAGLMADTNWTNVMQYRDHPSIKVNGLFTNEVGEWGGVRWVRTTQPFRFPIANLATAGEAYGVGRMDPAVPKYTNYSATGAIYSTPIFGKEAFGVTSLKGAKNSDLKPGIIVKNPGSGDTSNPLNRYSTVGWVLPGIARALNALFAVQIWSGA